MTVPQISERLVSRCVSTLFDPDVLGMKYLWEIGLDASAAECDRLEAELRAAIHSGLEGFAKANKIKQEAK